MTPERLRLLTSAVALPPAAFATLLADLPPPLRATVLRHLADTQHELVWDRIEDVFARSPRGMMHEEYRLMGERQRVALERRAQLDRMAAYRAEHPIREGEHDPAEVKARLSDPVDVAERLGLERPRGGKHWRCPAHGGASLMLSRHAGTLRAVCFGCGFKGDLFSLVAAVRGLNAKRDFRAVLAEAAAL